MSACFGTKRVTTNLVPPDPAKHVNYVRGMVLEVDEFTQEFAYLSGRDRWLAREAIGYGTLRGLALRWAKDGAGKIQPRVTVTSGVALSPCGQLICVGVDQCADIDQWLAARTGEISGKFDAGATGGELVLHVTLAYSDCKTDDAPVPGEPCRSAEDLMQPSRITDSFQLELSYDAPLQSEEDALRGFYSWLRNSLTIVPDSGQSVALGVFTERVRNWETPDSDAPAITIRAGDVPLYATTALRLWVTELRGNAERSGALRRFKNWLAEVAHGAGGTTSELEFLAEVRRWTPRTYVWPDAVVVNDSNLGEFGQKAIALWDTEIAPKWYGEPCGCRAPNNSDCRDDRLLLGSLRFNVVKTAGNSWMVDIPVPPSAKSPAVDESQRPVLGHLRALEAQLIPTPEPGTGGASTSLSPQASCRRVAMGRLIPGRAQTTPVFGALAISQVEAGTVHFTFPDFTPPNGAHDYVVQAIASYHDSISKSQAAVRFGGFEQGGFFYKVTRSNKDVAKTELEKMEFQVEVTMIVKPS